MKLYTNRFLVCFVLVTLMCVGAAKAQLSANATVFATGLESPRGLTFGPDGDLYVAEGGMGGAVTTTETQCDQVPAPVGPYSGGFTARISKIDALGHVTTVIDGLPSSQTSPAQGSLVSGVSDVKFIGKTLYALTAGAGCSHGLNGTSNGIFKVNSNGTWTMIADLSSFQKAHPVANPDLADFEPDGTWYSMVAVRGELIAAEPNHQEIDSVNPTTGGIRRIIDMSKLSAAWQGPTSIVYHGNFYIGDLTPFPIVDGAAKVFKLTPSGEIKTVATGLTTVLGVAFDHEGRMYVLENTTGGGNMFPTPNTGKVVRVTAHGLETIATGLSLPTAMTFGPDGALYVSNLGFGPPTGEIVRITVPAK